MRSFVVLPAFLLASAAPLLAQRGTTAAITPADLRARLSIFAHDSMGGRGTGSPGHQKAVRYLAAELRRLGLRPAGDSGTFLQRVPLVRMGFDSASTLTLNGRALRAGVDFQPRNGGANARAMRSAAIVFAGRWPDTANMLPSAAAAGRVVVVVPSGTAGPAATVARNPITTRYAAATAIVIANMDLVPPQELEFYRSAPMSLDLGATGAPETPSYFHVTQPVLREMFGGSDPAQLRAGQAGGTLEGAIRYRGYPIEAYNVVGVIPGRDPARRGQYVAIGAHSDAIGIVAPRDKDSTRAWMGQLNALQRQGLQGPALAQAVRNIRVNMDSIRRAGPPRIDSIVNGADDDGSGSVGVLEIAESFVRRPARRSLVFVWHVGEEQALFGSDWFTRSPTVPRDSIVAQLNMDMVGRGRADDESLGGPAYLQMIGSRRLSSELGTLVDSVNMASAAPFNMDYQYDAPGHPENFYCRSDHYMYARYGIPIAFFSTGGHRDYHQVTDEIEHIDFAKLTAVSRLVAAIGAELGNRPGRPVVDGVRAPSIDAPCQQ